jgi:hypothetical protein
MLADAHWPLHLTRDGCADAPDSTLSFSKLDSISAEPSEVGNRHLQQGRPAPIVERNSPYFAEKQKTFESIG